MSQLVEVKVPDIGNFDSVDVIEVLVKPGDVIAREDSLITLESDKASMDIPSSHAGTVKEIKVKVGDKVAKDSPILLLEVQNLGVTDQESASPASTPVAATAEVAKPASPAPAPSVPAPQLITAQFSGTSDIQTEVLVLGAGPGGYTAAFRAADLGKKVVLVERYPSLGGVCLNVGCIPSKALLHAAKVVTEAEEMAAHGINFGRPVIALSKLREWKDKEVVNKLTGGLVQLAKQRNIQVVHGVGKFTASNQLQVVDKLTGGLVQLAKQRNVQVVHGLGKFTASNQLQVVDAEGKTTTIGFENAIIAAGSQASKIPNVPEDPRIMDSTGALLLEDIPNRLLVIGGGIIGLEMGTVYDAFGSKVSVVEMTDGLIQGCDRDLVRPLQKRMEKRFEKIMLSTKVTSIEAKKDGIHVSFEGENAVEPQVYDRVLVAIGRRPNGLN
ncbi:MAG TPA: FAD-dependent oxidoreductase, partial [Methylophilaceae bacterium]